MASGFTYDEVMRWSVDDVLEWLERNNLAEFKVLVADERIDGPDFIKLDKGRISNCKNVPKPKREILLKRLKDFEKERAKMQKNAKSVQKTTNGRTVPPVPAVNAHPPAPSVPTRGAPPRQEDEVDDEYYLNDEDEWDDDQDVYDNDEILQPPKGRGSNVLPPPPPRITPPDDDEEDDEDYVQPADPAPNVRPPPPPPVDDDDDDCLYEKANPAMIPGRIPPPRNPPPQIQRTVPQAPPQGPIILPPRGGRPPVALPHQPSLYDENEPAFPAPPPRNASPPPISRSSGPSGPTGPKITAPPGVRGRAPLPVPQPDPEELYEPTDDIQAGSSSPQEIYEHPDDIEQPPSRPPVRDPRVLPPRPTSEVYEDPHDEKPPSLPPGRDARVLPPRPPSEVYEDPQDQAPINSEYESVEDVKAKMKQDSSGVSRRAPVPVPVPSDDSDDMYEPTDTVSSPRLPQQPLPPHPSSSARPGQRAPPPRPVPDPNDGEIYEETDEEPQVNRKHEDNPPEKPEKLQFGTKLKSGVPSVGIGGLDSCAVRDAKNKLRKGIPRDFSPAKVATDEPQEVATGVGGIRDMFQKKAQAQPPVKIPVSKVNPLPPAVASKANHLPPPAAKAAMVLPSPSPAENNAPGAPEPPKRQQGRAPPPGPPGGPPETVNSPVVIATPAAVDPNDITRQPWYFGDCEREKANKMLLGSIEDGTYLVRDSKGSGQPYTLGIYYKKDVFNITIRKRTDGKFALGKDKPDEHVFETIFDMIRFHRNNAIEVSKNGSFAGKVKLAKVVEK